MENRRKGWLESVARGERGRSFVDTQDGDDDVSSALPKQRESLKGRARHRSPPPDPSIRYRPTFEEEARMREERGILTSPTSSFDTLEGKTDGKSRGRLCKNSGDEEDEEHCDSFGAHRGRSGRQPILAFDENENEKEQEKEKDEKYNEKDDDDGDEMSRGRSGRISMLLFEDGNDGSGEFTSLRGRSFICMSSPRGRERHRSASPDRLLRRDDALSSSDDLLPPLAGGGVDLSSSTETEEVVAILDDACRLRSDSRSTFNADIVPAGGDPLSPIRSRFRLERGRSQHRLSSPRGRPRHRSASPQRVQSPEHNNSKQDK
jgi:hypothetical protein